MHDCLNLKGFVLHYKGQGEFNPLGTIPMSLSKYRGIWISDFPFGIHYPGKMSWELSLQHLQLEQMSQLPAFSQGAWLHLPNLKDHPRFDSLKQTRTMEISGSSQNKTTSSHF